MISLKLPSVPNSYHSPTQIARVATEQWAGQHLFCANCGRCLSACKANARAKDFDCSFCIEAYQLKSSQKAFGDRILGASYDATLAGIHSGQRPSLFLLWYNQLRMSVVDVRLVHKAFITESCVERRPPLGAAARRAGWVGCFIRLDLIPAFGKITVISNGEIISPDDLQSWWKRASRLMEGPVEQRSWIADVVRCVERLGDTFTLAEVYAFEQELSALHPANAHIRPKIRQVLQQLRDMGIIDFLGNGRYSKRV